MDQMKMGCLSSPRSKMILATIFLVIIIASILVIHFCMVDMVQQNVDDYKVSQTEFQNEHASLQLKLDTTQTDINNLDTDAFREAVEQSETTGEHIRIMQTSYDKHYEVFNQWDQDAFEKACEDLDSLEPMDRFLAEKYLGVDFNDPTSWDDVRIREDFDAFGKSIKTAIDEHLLNQTDLEATQTQINVLQAKFEDLEKQQNALVNPALMGPEQDAALITTGAFMGVTTLTTVGIGSMLRRENSPTWYNVFIFMMVLIIITSAMVAGGLGLANGNQNMFFLQATQYAMYIIFGTMFLGMLFGILCAPKESVILQNKINNKIAKVCALQEPITNETDPTSEGEETDVQVQIKQLREEIKELREQHEIALAKELNKTQPTTVTESNNGGGHLIRRLLEATRV